LVIFDCNGVLVDGEKIARAVLADAFASVGVPMTPQFLAQKFHGRRADDIFDAVEAATGRNLPAELISHVAKETIRRFRSELRPIPHAARALTWVRGPKAVASSSSFDRIRISLEITGLIGFFSQRLFSASGVAHGKPAPDLFLRLTGELSLDPAECIVVEDSAAGVSAAAKAGMTPIGFVGSSDTPGRLAEELGKVGARAVIADLRALHSTVLDLRGW